MVRRAAREPVAFIVGHREFWGLEFYVSSAVLIPRPETELIVEAGPSEVRAGIAVFESSTSAPAAAASPSHSVTSSHRPRSLAIDCSEAALAVAARNVSRHGLSGRVQLVRGNLLDTVVGPVDLIVSNPPYVARSDAPLLQPEVVRFEPGTALFADAGWDGRAPRALRNRRGEACARRLPHC